MLETARGSVSCEAIRKSHDSVADQLRTLSKSVLGLFSFSARIRLMDRLPTTELSCVPAVLLSGKIGTKLSPDLVGEERDGRNCFQAGLLCRPCHSGHWERGLSGFYWFDPAWMNTVSIQHGLEILGFWRNQSESRYHGQR